MCVVVGCTGQLVWISNVCMLYVRGGGMYWPTVDVPMPIGVTPAQPTVLFERGERWHLSYERALE